jgi:hypothetical protein
MTGNGGKGCISKLEILSNYLFCLEGDAIQWSLTKLLFLRIFGMSEFVSLVI